MVRVCRVRAYVRSLRIAAIVCNATTCLAARLIGICPSELGCCEGLEFQVGCGEVVRVCRVRAYSYVGLVVTACVKA